MTLESDIAEHCAGGDLLAAIRPAPPSPLT